MTNVDISRREVLRGLGGLALAPAIAPGARASQGGCPTSAIAAVPNRAVPVTNVEAYAQKSRIVIMARVRFAGAVVRESYLDAGLWLRRRAEHPRLRRIEDYGPLGVVHHFRLESPTDIDAPLQAAFRRRLARRRAAPCDVAEERRNTSAMVLPAGGAPG